MAKAIYIKAGQVVDYTNGSAADMDYLQIIALTDCIGVTVDKIPKGMTGSLSLSGVYELPAITTVAFTVGQKVYWDNATSTVTNVSASMIPCGYVVAPKATAGAVAQVKIG